MNTIFFFHENLVLSSAELKKKYSFDEIFYSFFFQFIIKKINLRGQPYIKIVSKYEIPNSNT